MNTAQTRDSRKYAAVNRNPSNDDLISDLIQASSPSNVHKLRPYLPSSHSSHGKRNFAKGGAFSKTSRQSLDKNNWLEGPDYANEINLQMALLKQSSDNSQDSYPKGVVNYKTSYPAGRRTKSDLAEDETASLGETADLNMTAGV